MKKIKRKAARSFLTGALLLLPVVIAASNALSSWFERLKAKEAAKWVDVEAVIERSERFQCGSRGATRSGLHVVYSYVYAGRLHQAHRIGFDQGPCGDDEWAQKSHAKYPQGRRVIAYLNPQAHHEATLSIEIPPISRFLMPGSFAFFGMVGMIYWMRQVLRNSPTRMRAMAKSH